MTGNGFSKEKARSFLQKLNKPLCFLEVFSEEKEKEYKEVAGNGDIKDIEELRLFIEIHERFQFIFEEFVENWIKGKQISNEEEEKIKKISDNEKKEGSYASTFEGLIKKNIQILEFIGQKERLKNIVKKWKETIKKIDAKLEKENFQSTELNSLKNQTQQPEKNNYPWGIIISMGAVIVGLIGVVVFLLNKSNKKKANKI